MFYMNQKNNGTSRLNLTIFRDTIKKIEKLGCNTTKYRIYTMSVASIYLLLVTKGEKKGSTKAEVDEIIRRSTGYCDNSLKT